MSAVVGVLRAFAVWPGGAVRNQSQAPLHSVFAFDFEVRKLSPKTLDLDLYERRKLNKR